LSRPTLQGNKYILAFVDHFSGWVRYVPCQDETAFTTAKIFVSGIIARFGRVDYILTDRAAGYMSKFFGTVSRILGVRYKTSAASAKRTNGLAERMIKSLNQGLKIYSNPDCDDRHLEFQIPLIEMSLNASIKTDTFCSPFFIFHGHSMPLPIKTDVTVPDNFYSREAKQYVNWLKELIKTVHDMVRINRIQAKQAMKQAYDKKHDVKEPHFKIGDLVLLKNTHITAGSNKILTRRPCIDNIYVIKQIVAFKEAGPSYKLTDQKTGKDLRGLIAYDRLKYYYTPRMSTITNTAVPSVVRHNSENKLWLFDGNNGA